MAYGDFHIVSYVIRRLFNTTHEVVPKPDKNDNCVMFESDQEKSGTQNELNS